MRKSHHDSQFESKIKRTIEGYIPQVFKVTCDNTEGGHTGTAFMFNAERGILATNHHVMHPDYGLYTIEDTEGNKYKKHQVKLIGISPSTQYGDYGFIQIPELAGRYQQIPIAKEHKIGIHDPVAFMGNSYGEFSVEEGNINGHYDFSMMKLIESFQVQLVSRGGASGSPTFNKQGELIGILYAGDDIHSLVHPIWFLEHAFNIMCKDPFPSPITFKSFHCVYDTINIDDVCNFYKMSKQELSPYLIDRDKTRQSLLCFNGNFKNKDHDGIQDGDVLLTVAGEPVGCNTIKITALLDQHEGAVAIEVLRINKVVQLNVLPETVEQTYSKKISLDDLHVFSNSSSFYLRSFAKEAPVMVMDQNSMLGVKHYSVYDLETEDGFAGVISKVGDRDVSNFDEFLAVFYDAYMVNEDEYLIFTIADDKGTMIATHHVDLTTLSNLEPVVTFFNDIDKRWNKLRLSDYLRAHGLLD